MKSWFLSLTVSSACNKSETKLVQTIQQDVNQDHLQSVLQSLTDRTEPEMLLHELPRTHAQISASFCNVHNNARPSNLTI